VRSNVDPAGDGVPAVTSETVYDAAGRPLATRSTTEEAWTCTTRDAAGRAVLTENLGAEGDEERTVEIDHAAPSAVAADDPLVTSVRSTTASGDTATETQTVDLLGRPVRVVDLWGTVVEQTYDPQFPERVVTSTVRPVGSAPVTTTYDYDQSGNRLRAVSGGLVLSAYTYDANGWVSSITNGPNVTTYDYDANGRPVVRTVDGPSGRWSEVQTLSPAGRTLAAVLDGPGDQDGAYDFTYDVDGQLVAARLDTPLAVAERAWTYAYDPDGNLTTRSTTDGAGATSTITNAYDGASHLVATDDPRFADPVDAARSGRVATDDHGRITEIGPLGIDYDADGNATGIGHADGSSVAWTYRFGRSVQRTVAAPAGSAAAPQVVRIGVGGVMYDGTGRYLGRGTGGSGSDLWQRADGSQRWTFSTIGGNEWFSTDAAGVATGPVALYEPFGRQVHPLPTPPSAPTGATTTTGPTTTAPTTTAPAPTTPTTTAPPTTTAAPTTTDGPAPTTAASTTVAPDGADPAASGRVATQGPAPTAPATPDPAADPLDPGFQMADRTTLGVLDVLPMGSRTYLPALGRFLQPDPIPGGSGNPYAYTDGDPVNSHDVSGNMPEWLRTTLGVVAGVAGVALAAVAGPRAGTYVASRVAAGASMARTRAVEHTVSFVVGAASGAAGAAGGQAIALGEVDAVPTVIVGLASGAIGALMSAYRAAQVDEMLQGYIDATKASRARNFEKVVQWKAKSFKNFKVSEIKRGMNGDVAFVGQPINVGQGGQVLGGGSSINVGPQPKSFTVIPGGKARGRSPSFGDKADVSADY
jgi:RHS repeat-associated protein